MPDITLSLTYYVLPWWCEGDDPFPPILMHACLVGNWDAE
jgi:hypothetical protein